jgi:hypothetical protein
MKSGYHIRLLNIATCCVLLAPSVFAQNAAPADRNNVNTAARPGDMMADSPVVFPKEGPIPAKYPPDVKELGEPVEKDYYLFSSPFQPPTGRTSNGRAVF